ncbi:Guanylate-binding protein 4, partial [Camelus dromedarius]
EIIKNKKDDFLMQNEETSIKYCQTKLDQLSKTLIKSIPAGTFSVPGGHELYRKAKEIIEKEYHQVPMKGVKADKALTDGEKPIAEEWTWKETADKEQELLKQKLQEQQQQVEAQKRSLQKHIVQMMEKLVRERENLLREPNKILEHQLKVNQAVAVVELDSFALVPQEGMGEGYSMVMQRSQVHLLLVIY